MNYSAENMLLLRISDSEIRAYSNKCPHQGANNQWSYNNSMFNCGNHNRSFSDDCSSTAMTCYSTSIDGNKMYFVSDREGGYGGRDNNRYGNST